MSIAFRRESDEEHLEPAFELPIPPGPSMVTPRGPAQIEDEVAKLEARLSEALAEEQRKVVQRDLRYWRVRQASAQLAPAPTGDEIAIGTRVTYQLNEVTRTIEVVGHDESDPISDRIGFTAPLVRAILGCEAGEEVELPSGQLLTILSVEPA